MKRTLVPVQTGRHSPYLIEVTEQEMPMQGLPKALHGVTFAHLSDFHGGYGGTEPVYEEAIARVNAFAPDFVFFTGDYVDDHATRPDIPMHEYLSRFQAKRGVYAAFGNHDHRRGIVHARRMLEQAHIPVLCNENREIAPGLRLAGLDDIHEGQPDVSRTLHGLSADSTTIVLSHNPRLIETVAEHNILILSGHTHGGQIVLPGLPAKWVCWFHLRCPQVAGAYTNGRARLYVNRGLGVTGQPFRYRCPAEIALFRLVGE